LITGAKPQAGLSTASLDSVVEVWI